MGFADREQKRRSVIDKMMEPEPPAVAETPAVQAEPAPAPARQPVVAGRRRETRSRKANFLIKPSVYERAAEKCRQLDISMNECVNQLLEQWTQD